MKAFRFNALKRTGADGIKTEINNEDRANNATDAVTTSCRTRGDPETCDLDAITDLLANIAHLCDRDGHDFNKAIKTAKLNWKMER
jgi:hypothetical protein